jgi:DNA-binding response OmpR family regulator
MTHTDLPRQTPWRILVVDDERSHGMVCMTALETVAEYEAKLELSALQALTTVRDWQPDLVVIDIKMPEINGLEFAQRLIDDNCDAGRMFLTSLNSSRDEVAGLKLADEYITKPFQPLVFLSRVQKVLDRRAERQAEREAAVLPRPALRVRRPVIDLAESRMRVPHGADVKLTPTEMRLARALLDGEGETVPYLELIRAIYGEHALDGADESQVKNCEGTVQVYVSRVRKKIERDPQNPQLILTISGVGYRYNLQPS